MLTGSGGIGRRARHDAVSRCLLSGMTATGGSAQPFPGARLNAGFCCPAARRERARILHGVTTEDGGTEVFATNSNPFPAKRPTGARPLGSADRRGAAPF